MKNFESVCTDHAQPASIANSIAAGGIDLPDGFEALAIGQSVRARYEAQFHDPSGRAHDRGAIAQPMRKVAMHSHCNSSLSSPAGELTMLRKFLLLAAMCALVCPFVVNARSESPLAVSAVIADAAEQGPTVQGTLRFTVVNAGDQNLTGVKLRLVSPASGSLGSGSVEVGNVDMDATVVATTAFRFEKGFWVSTDPLIVEASYKGQRDGNDVRVTLRVARDGGAR